MSRCRTHQSEIYAADHEEEPGRNLEEEWNVYGKDGCGDTAKVVSTQCEARGTEGHSQHLDKTESTRAVCRSQRRNISARQRADSQLVRFWLVKGRVNSQLEELSHKLRATQLTEKEDEADHDYDDPRENGEDGAADLIWNRCRREERWRRERQGRLATTSNKGKVAHKSLRSCRSPSPHCPGSLS